MSNEITVQELKEILGKALVIDVRRDDERANGFIKGSIHIPLDELPLKINEIIANPSTKEVYFYCRSGVRSANACTVFLQTGMKAFNVKGGIIAWEEAGFEVAK